MGAPFTTVSSSWSNASPTDVTSSLPGVGSAGAAVAPRRQASTFFFRLLMPLRFIRRRRFRDQLEISSETVRGISSEISSGTLRAASTALPRPLPTSLLRPRRARPQPLRPKLPSRLRPRVGVADRLSDVACDLAGASSERPPGAAMKNRSRRPSSCSTRIDLQPAPAPGWPAGSPPAGGAAPPRAESGRSRCRSGSCPRPPPAGRRSG